MNAPVPGFPGYGDIRSVGLSLDHADHMVENVVATYALPYAVLPGFLINAGIVAIPMVTDDAEVVADCKLGAELARAGGGFSVRSTAPVMMGQIQVLDVPDYGEAVRRVHEAAPDLIDWLNTRNPSTVSRHSRAVGMEVRIVAGDRLADEHDEGRAALMSYSAMLAPAPEEAMPAIRMLIVHVHYDCADAMGANLINTACEALSPRIELITGGRVNLCILTNLSDRRRARAACVIPANRIAGRAHEIASAARLFEFDSAWASAHNKRVMDAIEAVVMATANDWRAIEAGAHAYAARNGRYEPLAVWRVDEHGDLAGEIELPLAVGIVGGATRVHPLAQASLRVMQVTSARALSEIIACAGLARSIAAVCRAV